MKLLPSIFLCIAKCNWIKWTCKNVLCSNKNKIHILFSYIYSLDNHILNFLWLDSGGMLFLAMYTTSTLACMDWSMPIQCYWSKIVPSSHHLPAFGLVAHTYVQDHVWTISASGVPGRFVHLPPHPSSS